MRTIVFSDSHISNTSNNLEPITKLCNKIIYNKPDLVVMNGDIFDPWKTKWEDIKKLAQYDTLEKMCLSRTKAGLPTVYIKGNHDWQIPQVILPATIKTAKYEASDCECKYIFIHGWTFDVIWQTPLVHDIAFLIADKAPWLMIPLYNALFRRSLPSVKKAMVSGKMRLVEQQNDQCALDEAMNDWNLHYATIQLRAAKYAHSKKARVITGHSHAPAAFNGLIADSGDLLDSNTYLDIIDNVVTLKKL